MYMLDIMSVLTHSNTDENFLKTVIMLF